ncbi:hypothetical protein [Clostridium perfringens]|uniref:hypothetical protein n=1 Tax=Clostridium perfringens TaxID=1502 RepID=UPI00112AC40C|nr:hypothetical protein [Clostridium perfringens]TPF98692.1 hypothetical protein XA71_12505 [Clostridium perfringens A]
MGLIFVILMLIFMAAMYLNLLKGAKKADIKLNKLNKLNMEDNTIKLKEELKFGNYIICESKDGIEIKEI